MNVSMNLLGLLLLLLLGGLLGLPAGSAEGPVQRGVTMR
jgi:hypothetical protein